MTDLQKKIRALTEHARSLAIEAERYAVMSQHDRSAQLLYQSTEIMADVERMTTNGNG